MVAILVPDYDAGITYFVDKLGFDMLEDSDHGGGKRWVRVGSLKNQTQFLLAKAVGDQRASVGNQGGGRVWLFLQTDDFMGDYTAMKAKGVQFEEEPRHEPYGSVAVFKDDFGNRWDLIQFEDPSP